jgi:hypothetical protein
MVCPSCWRPICGGPRPGCQVLNLAHAQYFASFAPRQSRNGARDTAVRTSWLDSTALVMLDAGKPPRGVVQQGIVM